MTKHNASKGYRVYRNLHKGNYTVQGWVDCVGWRKIDEGETIVAEDVGFRVYTNGRNKVREERSKNVHAFVLCSAYEAYGDDEIVVDDDLRRVTYNPYTMDSFQYADDGSEVGYTEMLVLTMHGVFDPEISA